MHKRNQRAKNMLLALTIATLAWIGATCGPGIADTVTAKPGLAPQFSRWPVPMYTSSVDKTMTRAPNSYEIDTKDARPKAIAWYVAKLRGRALVLDKKGQAKELPGQIAVDGGVYVINFMVIPTGTSINVVKN